MFTIRIAISALAGWLSVQWLGQLGIENVVLHALLLFVVVTAFWARLLGVLLGRVRRKEGLFLQEDPPQPEAA